MPKVTEAHKAAVRERLVRAGLDCVEEKGYERTTIRDILERSGLSAGAFYHYFRSKDELIGAIGDFIADVEIGVASERAGEAATSVGEVLAAIAAQLMDPRTFGSLLPSARAQAAHVQAIREGLARYDRRVVGAGDSLSKQAQSEGDLSAEIDTEALVELTLLVYEGIQSKAQSDTFVTSPARIGATFLRLLAFGAAPDGSGYRERIMQKLGENR